MTNNPSDVSTPEAKSPATKVMRPIFGSSKLLSKLSRASLRSYRPPTLYRASSTTSSSSSSQTTTSPTMETASSPSPLKSSDKENSPDQANMSPSLSSMSSDAASRYAASASGSDQAAPSPDATQTMFLHALVDAISEEPVKKSQNAPVKLPSFSTLASMESTAAMATKSNSGTSQSSLPSSVPYASMTSSYSSPRYVSPYVAPQPSHQHAYTNSYGTSMYAYGSGLPGPYSPSMDAKRSYFTAHGSPMTPSSSQSSLHQSAGDASKRGRFGSNDGPSSPFSHGTLTTSTGYPGTRWYNPLMPSYSSAGMHTSTTRHALPPLAIKCDSQPPFTGRYGHDDLAKAYDCYPPASNSNSLETRRPVEAKGLPSEQATTVNSPNVRHAHDHVVPMTRPKSPMMKPPSAVTKKHSDVDDSENDSTNDSVSDDDEDSHGNEGGKTSPFSSTHAITQTLTTHVGTNRKLEVSNAGATVNLPQIPFNQHYAQRKAHKLAERKRRREMKRLFDSLRGLLPAVGGSGSADAKAKLSKWEILNGAVDVIDALVRKQNVLLSKRGYLLPRLGLGASSGGLLPKTMAAPVGVPSLSSHHASFPSSLASSSVSISPGSSMSISSTSSPTSNAPNAMVQLGAQK